VSILLLFGAAWGSVILFVMVSKGQREPLVDLSLFKAWSFTGNRTSPPPVASRSREQR